eukprot:1869043-Lingulodinium_polyedra.AAC.1
MPFRTFSGFWLGVPLGRPRPGSPLPGSSRTDVKSAALSSTLWYGERPPSRAVVVPGVAGAARSVPA